MASLRKFLLLCGFVASTVAVPLSQRSQCARYCSAESDFALTPGSTYTYDYETTAVTTVQGATQDKTQLQLTAHADIEVISKCELSLRLRGVQLKLSDPDTPDYLISLRGVRDFARALEKHHMRFSFQNGQVEHVCPLENVPDWITNIQKGVLSAFQTYVVKPDWTTRTLETDILGKCTAEYHSLGRSWQGMHTVRKTKDLSSCTERENVDTYLQGTPYATDFQTRSLPVVKGNQECEQVIGNGFLQSSSCSEKLVFRPFSSRGNGVVTSVTQKLTYVGTTSRTFTGNDYRPTQEPLLYKHSKPEINLAKIGQETEEALRELCEASKDDITITVPRKFSTFVYKLKKMTFTGLKAFHQKTEQICPGNSKAKKFFMDAIPLVNTLESASFIHEMISKKQVSESESKVWLTSLAFLTESSPEMISTLTPLLDGKYDQAILGISSLIKNFCNGKDCSDIPEVRNAVYKLAENLGENCFSGEEKTIILSLKAIGNIGYLFGKERTLEACYQNPQIRTEARLAAIEAFRRVSCDINREDLLKIYSNYNEDTEMRISAYLAVMKCPTADVIDQVKNIMMSEKINHVGSFVWTHLNALAKSKHPERQEIRLIVSNLYLMNKFEADARKFSTANEATFFLESIDSGIHVDSHLIYSTDSYLPRSAMFNLTVDVFGKTCNLFQIDGRMEGLEQVVESFFGPSGYFPQEHVSKMLRAKRSVDKTKLNQIESKYNENARAQQQPYGSLDVKVFGTSMWYNQYRHDENGVPEINLLDIVTNLAEQNEKEYSRSFTFLDTTFTIPMTSGLPLKIAVNGTASVGLKIGGKFDVKSFQHVDVLGHIEPSGAIEIASLLSIDAGNVARSGMRVVATMHSSSILDGKVEVKNGEVVRARLNMPKDRIDIFNIESKVYLMHGMEEREKTTDNREGTHMESCTGRTFNRVFGVKFCSELELPPYRVNSPLHPLNGPARFNLFIEKSDASLKSYNFDALWKTDVKNGKFFKQGIVSFNTPDSHIDRDIKMEINLNQADHTATLKLKTPLKRVGLHAKFLNEDLQKKLDFHVSIDDKEAFFIQSDFRTTRDKNSVTYTPSLEVRIPSKRLAAVSGNVQLKHGQKYTAQLQVEDLTVKPILAKANVEIGRRDRYDVELSLSSFALDGTVKGYAQLGDSMSSRITADYRIMESKMNRMSVVCKMRNLSANELTKYSGQLNIQASVLPEWNTELQFESMKTTGHIENTFTLSLGDGARSRVHTIKMQEILRYEGSLENNKVDASISLSYPEKRINYGLSMNHENTENSLKNNLQIQYDTKKAIKTEVNLKKNSNGPLSLASELKLKYPGREAAIQAELTESSTREYRGTLFCQWQQGKQVGAVVHYKNKSSGSRFKHEVNGNLNLPNQPQITFASTIGHEQQQFSGFVETSIGSEKYRIKSDLYLGNGINHRLATQVILRNEIYNLEAAITNLKSKLNGNVEIKMPNRHRITAKLEGKIGDTLKFGSFETYWDADRDTSKRLTFNGELRGQKEGYDGKFNMHYRRRSVKGLFTTSLQGDLLSAKWKTNNKFELEWSPKDRVTAVFLTNVLIDRSRQQVNNHIEFTSPFYGYENITFGITHLFTNQQWNSELSTLMPWSNELTLTSSGKYSFVRDNTVIEALVKAQTSYSGYEEMYATITHEQTWKELQNKIELKWGMDRRIKLQVTGANQTPMIKGTVSLQTPFANLKDIFGEVSHVYTSNNYQTKGELRWAPSKKVNVNFDGSHELSGRRRICTVNIEATSPFRAFENTGMKITYSNDGITLNTDTETSWNKKRVATSFTLALRNQRYNKNMEGKFLLTTPFQNYDYVQIVTSLDMNENSYKFNIDGQLPHRSTLSFNSQGKMGSINDVEINAVLIGQSPKIMNPQRISFDLVHKLQNSKLRSTLEASVGKDRVTVLLIGLFESSYHSRNVEFSASLNTPFNDFEELKLDLNHNFRASEYLTNFQINKNKLSFALNHKLTFRELLNFDTTAEMTSTVDMLNGKLSIAHVSNGRQIEHNSFVLWDKNKKIQLNAQFSDKSFMKEIVVKMSTPFRKFRDIEIKSSYEQKDWEYKASISTVWDRRNKMSLSGDLNNFRWESLQAKLEFLSPFKGYEFYSSTVKYDLTNPQKDAEISFMWDLSNKKSVVLSGNFINSYRQTSLVLILTTPFNKFERTSLTAEYNTNSQERSVNVFYERGLEKVVFKGRTAFRRESSEISVDLNTPYEPMKEVTSFVKYSKLSNGKKGEFSLKINRYNKYETVLQYQLKDSSFSASMTAITPIRDFERLSAEFNGFSNSKQTKSDFGVSWGRNKKITVEKDLQIGKEDSSFLLTIQTPYRGYEAMSLEAKYKQKQGKNEGNIMATMNGKQLYYGAYDAKFGGENLAKIQINMDSPYSPMKNVQLIVSVDSNEDINQLISTLKWEDKEADIQLLLNKKLGQFYEAKMKLNTPFEGFKLLSFDSSLRNDRNQFMDGRLIIVTPFEILRNLDVYGEYKNDDSGNLVIVKIDSPITFKVTGQFSNSRFSPLTASLEVDAPFISFKNIKAAVQANVNDPTNVDIALSLKSPKFSHELITTLLTQNKIMNFQMKAESSSLPSKTIVVSVKSTYNDASKITGEASIELLGNAHYISGHYKTNRNSYEVLINADSSLLPEGKAQLKAALNRQRRDKNIDASISYSMSDYSHVLTAKYENKGNQITANVNINSPYCTLVTQAKYTNNDNKDIELVLSASTFGTEHTFVTSVKNYDQDKFIQFKVDCSAAEFLNPLTITGVFKQGGSTDVSLSINSLNKEVRIAGNMKRNGWENIEAFLTLNTPFEGLNMLRLNGKLENKNFQNIDCSFQLESSNQALSSLGMTSKLIRTKGSEEMSLMLRLPSRYYQNIQILGNLHYYPDYSSADSRITLSLPQNKYAIYGQYGIGRSRISGRGEIELDNTKWSASGRLEHTAAKRDISLTFTTPRSDSYTVGGGYGNMENQKMISVTYSGPRNVRYSLNSSLAFDTLNNFDFEYQIQTPIYNYQSLQGLVNHHFNSHSLLSNFEHTMDGLRLFAKVNHHFQRDGMKGNVHVSLPYQSLKDMKLSYNRVKKYTNIEDTVELDYNRAKQMKIKVILFGGKSSHFVLDVKPLELTISADKKQITNGQEIVFKSSRLGRIVSFRTSHQLDNKQFLHDAAFSWDEKAEKRISYDFRLADTDTGKELWSRLDTPIRSLMLKGNFTQTSRARSGGIDFYWDASRSLEKRMGVGLMHTDMSTGSQNSHRVQIIVEHPKLKKDIVQTNVITIGPSEFHAKSELHYTRERQHNLLIEVRGSDLSRSRESHYKGEFTLRHPISQVDIRASAEVFNTKLESSANFLLNTLDKRQSQNIREVRAKIMKLRQEIDLLMRSNNDRINVAGKMTGRNGEYDVLLEKKSNDVKDLTANMRFSRKNNALDVSVLNEEETGLQVSASFPRELVSLKVSHSNKGNLITDADMFIGLEQSKVLKSRASWRPRLMRELRIHTGETIRSFSRSSKQQFNAFMSSLSEEWNSKASLISQSVADLATPFLEDLRVGVTEIENDIRATKNAFWQMYRRNEFQMQDIVQGYKDLKEMAKDMIGGIMLGCEVLYNITMENLEDMYYTVYYAILDCSDYMSRVYSKMCKVVRHHMDVLKHCLRRCTEKCLLRMKEWMKVTYTKLQSLTNQMVMRMDKFVRSYAPCIIDGYYYMKNTADRLRQTFNNLSSRSSTWVRNNRFFLALGNYANNVMSTVQAFVDYEYAESAQAFLDRYYDMKLMETIVNHPSVEYMSGAANTAFRKSIEVYHNLGMDYAISALAESAKNYVKSMAMNSVQELMEDLYRSQAGAKYTFTPERGYVSLEFTLPGPRNSLVEVFDYKTYPEYQKMMNVNTMANEYYKDFCIWDYYYKVSKFFTLNYWLPAFRAHAILSGNQHYITFDKKSYDFAGKCSYLLARDFVDGNFTVVVNYEDNHRRKSLTIESDGRKIDIANDYKITLDDVRAESPIQTGDTIVMREGPNIRVNNEKKGFSIVCNFVHNYCKVSVSGFYFGKTAGLFGTFNYEPKLDFLTPGRHLVDDVETFTHSWEVGKSSCVSSENFATLPTNDYRVQQKCKSLYESSSSQFRACFKQVNPEAYLRMCISDLAAVMESEYDSTICQSAAAYLMECRSEGVALKMPKPCVRCERENGLFLNEGEAIQYSKERKTTAADVVFLVEEKQCNKDRVKYLSKLAQGIEDGFMQKGYRDIRYSVVAFGGNNIHSAPHVHTMDGWESGPLRSLDSAINSLQFGNGPVNILEAIRFAAALNFRAGTTKSFVLVKCSTCQSQELKAEYSEMLRTLLDSDITLHILMEQRYEMKNPNKNSKARRVIGVDKKFAYTLKDAKDPSGDGDLLAQLKIPKDVCIPLALEVNGSTFDSQFLMETKKNTNKKFMDIFSRLVVRTSMGSNNDWGMCCECLATEDGVGKNTCQRCVSAELASMISTDSIGMYDTIQRPRIRNRGH